MMREEPSSLSWNLVELGTVPSLCPPDFCHYIFYLGSISVEFRAELRHRDHQTNRINFDHLQNLQTPETLEGVLPDLGDVVMIQQDVVGLGETLEATPSNFGLFDPSVWWWLRSGQSFNLVVCQIAGMNHGIRAHAF